jgi:ribosomal protein S18 acetylase RimI-like enzyme
MIQPMDIRYERVDQQDLDAAIAFTLDAMHESHKIFLTEHEFQRDIVAKQAVIASRLKESSLDKEKYFGIAKQGDHIVGALSCRILDDSIFIDYIYVDKKCRGMGIGTRLIDACLQEVNNYKSISKIALQVYAQNTHAIAAYTKQGFIKVSEKQKEDTSLYIMERIINNF